MQMDGPPKLLALLKQIVEQLLSLLTMIACIYWLPNVIYKIIPSPAAVENSYFVLFFFEDFVFALVIILLVGAAFIERGAQDEAFPPLPGTI